MKVGEAISFLEKYPKDSEMVLRNGYFTFRHFTLENEKHIENNGGMLVMSLIKGELGYELTEEMKSDLERFRFLLDCKQTTKTRPELLKEFIETYSEEKEYDDVLQKSESKFATYEFIKNYINKEDPDKNRIIEEAIEHFRNNDMEEHKGWGFLIDLYKNK